MKKRFWLFFALFIMGISFITFGSDNTKRATMEENNIAINNPNQLSKKLKVLLIEINPILTSITNTQLYGTKNDGHPYASEYIYYNSSTATAHDIEKPINEMIEDIEEMSHGNIEIEMEREWLNEFPKWKVKIDLYNGTRGYGLDEETFVNASRVEGQDYGNWYNMLNSSFWNDDTAYQFDYNYLINKFNLVSRRNNKEFDQVWIYSIDPAQTFETVMVGREGETYWVNGALDESYNCDAFFMPTISMIRTDANLHAFGHGVEGIMQEVFNSTNTSTMSEKYVENHFHVNSVSDYNNLNLWERFTLTAHSNNNNYSSVGIIHYPFNGTSDYDYTNTTNVKSNWADWLNYPNFTNSFVTSNNSVWTNHQINTSLGDGEDKDPDRLYSRLWFYLMPHTTGYYEDGHVNNWWSYIVSLDYVNKITANGSKQLSINANEKVPVNYTLSYKSKNTETVTTVFEGANVHIADSTVVDYVDGVLYGKNAGSTTVQIFYDGISITYTVNVTGSITVPANNNLTDIRIDGVSIEGFSPSITSYIIETDKSSIEISATKEDDSVTINGTGIKTLEYGQNIVNITVTAENDETKVYVINVVRTTDDVNNSTVTLSYDPNGGTNCVPGVRIVNSGDVWGELCTTSRSGYDFNGWFTAKNGGLKVTNSTIANSNITVYAQWRKVTPSNPKTGIFTPIISLIVLGIISCTTFIVVMKKNSEINI